MQPIPFILKQQTAMDAEEYKEIRKALRSPKEHSRSFSKLTSARFNVERPEKLQ